MNTANIKKYAPLARNAFITAVTKRANELGIYASHIAEAKEEGQVLSVEGRSVDLKLKGARNKLIQRVESAGFTALMEFIAYTWFNRLCAIRYMELHDYLDHGIRVLSPSPSQGEGWGEGGLPEILEHAQDVAEGLGLNRDQIIELKLAGNQDELLYRTLLLGQCHALHKAMPFLFEAIDDETELLLPDNLTRTDSILRGLVNELPAQDWEQVEVIGWLYQFYISEKKDQVIGNVVKSEDIPAATQLFTPNWIVKYLVQNSVGRQWLQTYPDSSIKAGMEYYIEPAEQTDEVNAQIKAITPDSIEPESIKVLDPACGSGHILVEAYQVLKTIYEERGYRNRDIPQLILENNLFGLDIDDRAAQLAGFALMMLARADDKRIFTRNVQLNVMAMQEAGEELSVEGVALSSEEQEFALQTLLDLFADAKTFGSLIQVPDALAKRLPELHRVIEDQIDSPDIFAQHTAKVLLPLIKQAEILARKYDAVVANPPYMGGKYLNPLLKEYLKKHYKGFEKDLFSAFMIRNLEFAKESGQLGFMSPFVWMFISSYEELRTHFIDNATLTSLIQLEYSGFDGATVPICTFTLGKAHIPDYTGSYIKLSDFKGHKNQAPKTLEAINNPDCGWFHRAKPDDFKKIPGSPIAYWVSDKVRDIFENSPALGEVADARQGLATADNDRFLRLWHEVPVKGIGFGMENREQALHSGLKWFPYNKGGQFRKWYGNQDFVVNWENDGVEIRGFVDDKGKQRSRPQNTEYYFKSSVSWSDVTSSDISFRFFPKGFVYDVKGQSAFIENKDFQLKILKYCNNKFISFLSKIINPSLSFQVGNFNQLPFATDTLDFDEYFLINQSKNDWNTYETSWDFQSNPLVSGEWLVASSEKKTLPTHHSSLKTIYSNWQTHNRSAIAEMQRLEQENNRLFIDAYDLQDELTPDVPLEQITLTVNPKYRYGGNVSDEALKNRFQSDTLAELISYAIGCMMGRYALDKAGLVYAHSGNVDFDTIYNGVESDEWRGESEKLSGLNCMAEINGVGGASLQNDQSVSERGTLRINESDSESSRFDSIEHSGRTGSEIKSRVSPVYVNSTGFLSGGGNTNADSTASGLCKQQSISGDSELIGRDFKNTQLTTQQLKDLTHHSSLITHHFPPDDDGIIPLTDQEWFADDATHRFREFVRVVWGEDNLQQNLDFVAESLCLYALKPKSGETSLDTIRRYLSTQFYKDHLKTYKKRPIYWLFSSGKQKAFECLVYLHRYNESTLSRMRTEYVTPLLGKYEASGMVLQKQIEDASSTSDANRFKKSLTALEKKQTELSEFDDKLKHYADMRISLDLDDGVKVNYGKFGDLLAEVKAVTGGK